MGAPPCQLGVMMRQFAARRRNVALSTRRTGDWAAMFMVDNATGAKALVKAIERERERAGPVVPWWPWAPVVSLLRLAPPSMIKPFE